MKKHIQNPIFEIISATADELNIDAYVIGDSVRDIILEQPFKDIDVVAIDSGIELAKAVAKKIGKNTKVTVFKNFGTAMKLNLLELVKNYMIEVQENLLLKMEL